MKTITRVLLPLFLASGLAAQATGTQAMDQVIRSIESKRDACAEVAKQIWSFAEVGYQEEKSSALLQQQLRDAGVLELIASAATHGLLPLLTPPAEAVRAQVRIGCDVFRECFHAEPSGFWLPECAYAPGLENALQDANLRWFVVDAHGFSLAKPRPRRALYAPCFTAAAPGTW